MEKFDFSGWATRNDIKCSDGRTIRRNAFEGNDGQIVPLVWQHQHDNPMNVLGHALLENRPEGVYAYGKFNDSEMGKHAKLLVQHGDIKSLSIYANQLKQHGGDVLHGNIREVSVVLAGANEGAYIDFPILEHGEESTTEALIYSGLDIENSNGMELELVPISHSDDTSDEDYEEEEDDDEYNEDGETVEDVFETLTDDQKEAVYAIVGEILGDEEDDEDYDDEEYAADGEDDDEEIEHADGPTVGDILSTLNDKQRLAVYAIVANAIAEVEEYDDDEEVEHSEYEGGEDTVMKHNVFDTETFEDENVLAHDAMEMMIEDTKKYGSLKESVLAHAEDYGIDGIEWLFPEDHNLNNTPAWIKRETGWVDAVMSGVNHTPFSRVRSRFANITEDEARAKGYMKGNRKKEEVFSLLKRSTSPQTVYKKQKLDRDDKIDITDFDVVAWIKGEMRMMLNEEIARAILLGDGRLASDDDKISEEHIRPIVNDADLFTIKAPVVTAQNADDATKAKAFIRAAIKARKNYKGSGNPTLFTTEDMLTEMLLLEDQVGRPLYQSEAQLATKLRVSKIVTVEVMENFMVQGVDPLMGVIVNLKDYTVGADKGGSINMFEDFDIDYNQEKYLIETRCSGALTVPYSAIILTDGTRQGTSVSGGVQGSKTTYEEVTPVGTENPANEGWYEVVNGKYVKTTDTTVTQDKDYFVRHAVA